MIERLITRSQAILRAYWGLGPDQFNLVDTLIPTIDSDHFLRGPEDTLILSGTVGGVAPGAGSTVSLNLPAAAASYFLDAVSWNSTGPATSGNWRAQPRITRTGNIWGVAADIALTERCDLIPKLAGLSTYFSFFPAKPILLLSNGLNTDGIGVTFFNDAGSVGNMSLVAYAVLRPMEAIKKAG